MDVIESFTSKFKPYGSLGLHGVRLPKFSIEKKYYERLGLSNRISHKKFLRALCSEGMGKIAHKLKAPKEEYDERLEKELSLLEELGYVDYILLIWDIINYAREEGIAIGFGRGSAAGSLVLYLVGITGVDPLEFNLLFERFISRARAKSSVVDGVTYYQGDLLPDVDIDFEYLNRHKVIEYIQEKYKGKTCKVLTITTLQGKICIKEVCKIAGGYSENESVQVSDMVDKVFGKVQHLSEAIDEGLKEWVKEKNVNNRYCDNKQISEIAASIEGLPKNFGVHAAAMGISHEPLEKICPVQLTKDGELVSSYIKDDIEQIMIKADVLGLKTLTIVDNISKETGDDFRLIDYNDPKIYSNLNSWGDNVHGIFQFEGYAALRAMKKVLPESIHDLATINALARPGAIFEVDNFAERKNNGKEVPEVEKNIDRILSKTKGVIAFQEQLMAIAHETFGLTLDEAEILRRIIGKKKEKEIPPWKKKLERRTEEMGLPHSVFEFYWKSLEAASNYSFNASHAYAYSILAAQCAYYKGKYPSLFYRECLKIAKYSNNEGGPQAQVGKIIEEMKAFGMNIKPPDILKSEMDFSIDKDGEIRYALTSIRGIAEKKIEALNNFKSREHFNKFDLFEAAKSSGLNIGDLSALIQAGAMSSLDENRCLMVYQAQIWNLLTPREKKYIKRYGEKFDYSLFDTIKYVRENQLTDEGGKVLIIKDSRYNTIKKSSYKYHRIWALNKRNVDLANWFFERKLLGYSYSGSLYQIMKKTSDGNRAVMDPSEFKDLKNDATCYYCGIVTDSFDRPSAKGKNMLRLTVADSDFSIMGILYDDKYDKWSLDHLDDKKRPVFPKKDNIVYIRGNKSNDAVFLDDITILDDMVYLKLSDLKNERIPKEIEDMTSEKYHRSARAFRDACEKGGMWFVNNKTDLKVGYEVGDLNIKKYDFKTLVRYDEKGGGGIPIKYNWGKGSPELIALEGRTAFLVVWRDFLEKWIQTKCGSEEVFLDLPRMKEDTKGRNRIIEKIQNA